MRRSADSPRNHRSFVSAATRLLLACLLAALVSTSLVGCTTAEGSRETATVAPAPSPAPAPKDSAPEAPAPEEPAEPAEPSAAATPDLQLVPALVTGVVDGDTAYVRLKTNGSEEKVRFIGVDTPESTIHHEPYGAEASAYTKRQLAGKTVYLETDAELRDKYGRLLAYVWMSHPTLADQNGSPAAQEIRTRMFNAWLMRDGFAQVMTIPPNVKYAEEFLQLQREARDAERGLWSLPIADPTDSGDDEPAGAYVGNRNSKTLHRADCRWVSAMNPANKVPFGTSDAAVSAGYAPCKVCKP